MCGCYCISYFIAVLCAVVVQVLYGVMAGLGCQLPGGLLWLLWFQTVVSCGAVVYVLVPGLKMITRLLYLHFLPSISLLLVSGYLSYRFMEHVECHVYDTDVQPLLNAMNFAQGVIPVISVIVLSNDVRQSCKRAVYRETSSVDLDSE